MLAVKANFMLRQQYPAISIHFYDA